MVRMLHIVETLTPYGGVPVKLLRLAEQLDPDQGSLVFAVFRPAPLDEAMEKAGAKVLQIGSTDPLRVVKRLDRAIEEEAPTVVCSHHTRGLLTGYVAAKRRGIPLVHHEHSSADYRQGVGRLAARVLLPKAARIICNSLYTQRSIAAAYPGAASKLCHVHDPVEARTSVFDRPAIRQALGFGETDMVVGHVGGLIRQRDHVTLIRAVALLRQSCPHAKLLLVGDGPERRRLESMVDESGLAEHARFTGYRDAGEVLGYGYCSLYRTRSAYRYTLEDSVYVRQGSQGKGIGKALLAELIARCTALKYRQIIAVIGDSANAASIGVHAACGFLRVGTLRSVGFKFGRWVDSVLMQLPLGAGDGTKP